MDAVHNRHLRLKDAEAWVALGVAGLVLSLGATRRHPFGALLGAAAVPLLYRGINGEWPGTLPPQKTRARAVAHGVHLRESVRVELPVGEVYASWRRLDQLPRFMSHLESVTEMRDGRSRWVARGPGGLRVEWTAEILREVANQVLAWRSLPEADVASAGSVTFRAVRGGRSTQVSVHLQYESPAGKAGSFVASLFGRAPSQTIREDLRRFKQLLEAGEAPRATSST